jgi:hypothetical protein
LQSKVGIPFRKLVPLAVAALAAPALAVDTPITLSLSKPVYQPGEEVELRLDGPAGAVGVLFIDVSPGPTFFPGIGNIEIGFTSALGIVVFGPLPEGGESVLSRSYPCGSAILDQPIYMQAVSLGESGAPLLSNPVTLVHEDSEGICEPEGCTPGYWMSHTGNWPATGYAPGDSFDAVFGVDVYDPELTLLQAVTPPVPVLKTFASHAVAALLNASHPGSSFPLSPAEVIDLVANALLFGTADDQEDVKDMLEALNETNCPF